jgi:transcriptional regulator with GAF, ATPase, and Fis domain
VRVIAATNRQIATAVEAGRFRQDLYYRLNVYPIHLPPLRERGDDVLLLARAFAQRIGQRLGRTVEPPPDEAGHCLRAYAWSGNVRELENVIERAIITSPDGHLDLERALSQSAPAAVDPSTLEADTVLTAAQLQDLERQNLLRALARASGRVSGRGGAAELLGIPPSTLNSRMKALGIQRPQPTAG